MSAGACGAFVHGLEDEFMGECVVWNYLHIVHVNLQSLKIPLHILRDLHVARVSATQSIDL